ncbi:MAG: FtsH protease activity modulator HflK [Candidatus Neomarinimicrobiota bacterium]|jgi:membrane protease subunit HflK|nr:FtsH protease activity modulator HflK [Candidatus Neomarinimicrobiota bacterium]MED5248441.1 FtsH protease activity modulator HflK [Candidatus Neomarinimicrobiota bacterium]|tara:strand:+ start:10060 stop:11025 length:966 start_codon:yes stop_codon:yes gene_type:complete
MAYKRIIIGDQEIKIPKLSMGTFPLVGIFVVLWLLTGIYVVGPDEVGVVQTLGKYSRAAQSGLNYHFPYPIEKVSTPKVTEVKRIEIGFRTVGKNQYQTISRESLMLTGDENIVDAEMIVQYRIKDPVAYTFNFIEPELTVRQASEASLRTVVGRHNIDEALTSGKFMIQEEAKELIQNILDKYNTGILVVAVQLQDVSPPEQVISAFKDVASAKEDKNRMVNQAEGYRNDVIPKARGEAQAQIREAEGYKEARIARAEGDVSKFNAVLKEYRKSKEVTETRLFLETAEEILSNREKIIVPDGKEGSNLINLLNLKAKEGK